MKIVKKYDDFLNEKNQQLNEMAETNYNMMIDYTSLTGTETDEEITELCEKAKQYNVASVCIFPKNIATAAKCLEGSDVKVCTVISFPGGADSTEEKVAETKKAIDDGADECDMVLDYKYLKEKSDDMDGQVFGKLVDDVQALVDVCHNETNKLGEVLILKVIVESGLLNDEETAIATEVCIDAGADYIKTSTGKVGVGAEMNKAQIMKDVIDENSSNMKIKASGGIRNMNDVRKFATIVDRLGMGYASVDDINGIESEGDRY